MSGVQHLTQHIIHHFRDESFQAVDCMATDNQTHKNPQKNKPWYKETGPC